MKSLIVSLVFGSISVAALSGCSHLHKVQGAEGKSEIPAGIRVAIGGQEVKEGDRLSVFQTACKAERAGDRAAIPRKACRDTKIGEALVLKVLDHDSAIVQPQDGLVMSEAMKVEK